MSLPRSPTLHLESDLCQLESQATRSRMILEVPMSPNDDNPEEVKKAKTKYLWFGYGSYSGLEGLGPMNPGNMRAAPDIIEKLFELFGVRKKTKEEPQENK